MYISVFSDELYKEVTEILPLYKKWGLTHVDFRARINGKAIENQTQEELLALKKQMDSLGLKTGALQTSLCKINNPTPEQQKKEMGKLEGIIRAADALQCRLVRSFNYWQHYNDDPLFGQLATRPDEMSKVLELYYPIAKRAKEAGLILGFENCGQSPEEVIVLLEALNVPGWGMAWDVSNNFETLPEAQGDCVEYFIRAIGHSNMVHVKARGILKELEGRKVPWDRVLAGVSASGKDLPVSIETHNSAASLITHEDATYRCLEHLRKVWPSAAPGDIRSAVAESRKVDFERPYKDDPVRIVVVGLGMGKTRVKQISETSGIKLAGVCDINIEKARETGRQYGVPFSDDINVFLNDPSVEAVYIVTPTGLHCSMAEQCLMAGKHVLTTKPMDAESGNCIRAMKLAKEKGLLLGVDFDLHFRGQLTELRKAAEEGWFGKILCANISLNIKRTREYFKENGGWRGTWKLDGGGAMSNQGIHEIDRLITVLGVPDRVRASIATQVHEIEAEDIGTAQWEYKNGCIARFTVTTTYPAPAWYVKIDIHGTKGAYILCSGGPEGDHIYWWADGKWSENAPYPVSRKWRQGSDNFAYSLRTGEKLLVGAREGIISRIVLDRMYDSAKAGENWVDVVIPDDI
ncbi:MAG: Gfo/Idh/MocA family oxidoreductase [Eubacteriales bacterium]|nr:Gfo/Idh/MocA family oxidoreductase [Eubacteriales bacterium]